MEAVFRTNLPLERQFRGKFVFEQVQKWDEGLVDASSLRCVVAGLKPAPTGTGFG